MFQYSILYVIFPPALPSVINRRTKEQKQTYTTTSRCQSILSAVLPATWATWGEGW